MNDINGKNLISLGSDPFNAQLNNFCSIVFLPEEEELINKVNFVHKKYCGKDHDFKDTYLEAKLIMRDMATPFWYEGVANQLVDVMENKEKEFFDAFDVPLVSVDKIKNDDFNNRKRKILDIKECIQGIKHKRKQNLAKMFRGEYFNKTGRDINITNENYIFIFESFRDELIDLFKNHNIKNV